MEGIKHNLTKLRQTLLVFFMMATMSIICLINSHTSANQAGQKEPGTCLAEDAQPTYSASNQNGKTIFIICGAANKLSLTEKQLETMRDFAANRNDPSVRLTENGELDIAAPLPGFVVQNYKDTATIDGWRGVVKALEYIKDNSGNNYGHRYLALDGINKINEALKGPVPYSITKENKTVVLKTTSALPSCSDIDELKNLSASGFELLEESGAWYCKVTMTKSPYFTMPRQNSIVDNIISDSLAVAEQRGLSEDSAILQLMLNNFGMNLPRPVSNGVITYTLPSTFTIIDSDTIGQTPNKPIFNGFENNSLVVPVSIKITDDIARAAGGKPIGFKLAVKDGMGNEQELGKIDPGYNIPTDSTFAVDLASLSAGNYQFIARLLAGNDIVSSLIQPVTVIDKTRALPIMPIGGCSVDDTGAPFYTRNKADGQVFIICDGLKKLNISDSLAGTIKKFTGVSANPTIIIHDNGEIDIDTPFPEFIVVDYENNNTTAGWNKVIELLRYINNNSGNNLLSRYWAMDSIDKVNKALEGPIFFEAVRDKEGNLIFVAEESFSVCADLPAIKAAGDPDLIVEQRNGKRFCAVRSEITLESYYRQPRPNSIVERLLSDGLREAERRKLSASQAVLLDMLEQYRAVAPLESGNGVLSLSAPKTLVITNFAEVISAKSQLDKNPKAAAIPPYIYANTRNNAFGVKTKTVITEEIARKADRQTIGSQLYIVSNGNRAVVGQEPLSFDVPTAREYIVDINRYPGEFLTVGEHSLVLELIRADGTILSTISQPLRVAAIRQPATGFESCIIDSSNQELCISRIDPVVSGNSGGATVTINTKGSRNNNNRFFSLSYDTGSYLNTVVNTVQPNTVYWLSDTTSSSGGSNYCRATPTDSDCTKICLDSTQCTSFIVYGHDKIISDAAVLASLSKIRIIGVLSASRIRLPAAVNPAELDDIYGHDGKRNEELYKAWDGLKQVYQFVANQAGSDRHELNRYAANRIIEEISRRLETSSASYVKTKAGPFSVYDASKHIASADERNVFIEHNDLYPASYQDKDEIILSQNVDAGKYLAGQDGVLKINGLNRKNWENLRNLYEAVQRSAERRGRNQGDEAFDEANQARIAKETIASYLQKYDQLPKNRTYERDGSDFIIYDIARYGFTQEDMDRIQNLEHFRGKDIQKFFINGNSRVPAKINKGQISSAITPAVVSVANKMHAAYEAVSKAASGQDKTDAEQSMTIIKNEIVNAYGCGGEPFSLKGNNFCLSDINKKFGQDKVKLISDLLDSPLQDGGTGITLVDDYELILPFNLQSSLIVISDYDNDREINGWKNIAEAYNYVINNASDNLDYYNYAKTSKVNIEAALIGPPPFNASGSLDRIIIKNSVSQCASINKDDDADVYKDNGDNSCIIMKQDSNGQPYKYIEPKSGSRAEQLMESVLAVANQPAYRDLNIGFPSQKTYFQFIDEMLDGYRSQITGSTSQDGLTISAPKSLKITEQAAQMIEYRLNGLPGQYNPAEAGNVNIFDFYKRTVSVEYKLSVNEISNKMPAGTSGGDLKLFIVTGDKKTLLNQKRITNSGTIDWTADIDSHIDHLANGTHILSLEFSADGREIAKVKQNFEIILPEVPTTPPDDPNNPESCTGGSIEITIPNQTITKPNRMDPIVLKLTPPAAPATGTDPDKYMIYASTGSDGSSGWNDLTGTPVQYNVTTGTAANVSYHPTWPTASTSTGQHVIRVKTFRNGVCAAKAETTVYVNSENCSGGTCKPSGDDGGGGGGTPVGDKPIDKLIAVIRHYYIILIPGLAVIALLYGGLLYISSAGNTKRSEQGKRIVIYTSIGIVIATLVYVIVSVAVMEINKFIK